VRILLTGATGLVGQGVLRECLRAADVTHVAALGRHPSGQSDPKLEDIVVPDFADLRAVEDRLHPFDACLYCAGTLPLGMTEADFRHVTVELTLNVARTLARLNPALVFAYVSGAASNPDSHLMPLRVKGEAERALAALPIRTVMLRPGAIQPVEGVRSPHAGLGLVYALGGPFMGLGVRLLPGAMTTTARIGRAMLALLRQDDRPAVVENAEINRLGG
jgi:uncharacterized protein YbjT (DUF2867 family)